MKFGSPVVCMILLSALVFCGQPALAQETPQDATGKKAQPAVSDVTRPASSEDAQAVVPGKSQPAAPNESQPVAPGETQPAAPNESQPAAPGETQPSVRIAEAVVCQDVVDRTPVGAGDAFDKEVPRVYCFTHVVGAAPGTQLIHNWYYQGNLKASVNLTVGSSDYRTWSYKTMMPQWTGEWMVEILFANGTPMENIIFVLK